MPYLNPIVEWSGPSRPSFSAGVWFGDKGTGLVEDWVQVLEKYGGDEHGWGRGGRTIFGKSGARMSIGMGRRWGGSEACRGRREKTGAWIWAWAARPILPQSPLFFSNDSLGKLSVRRWCCHALQYEGEDWNGETISTTLFHNSPGGVGSDWCYCKYVVVVSSPDTDKGEFRNCSWSIFIEWSTSVEYVLPGRSGLRLRVRLLIPPQFDNRVCGIAD